VATGVSNVNYSLYKKLRALKNDIYFTFTWHINLKFKHKISNLFMKNMHVVAPWTLLPGVVALLPANDSYGGMLLSP
jgi:hypothetical protein